MIFLYLFTYFSLIIFIVLVASKIIKYSSAPVHVRWELYPVAHEPKKNKYGGSYYEEPEWWKSKNKKNHVAELWAMFEEIIFFCNLFWCFQVVRTQPFNKLNGCLYCTEL